MAKAKTILAYAAMIALAPADLFKRLGEKVKVHDNLEKAKTRIVENLKEFAKEIAALKTLYTSRIEKHEIPGDTAFKKYFKDNVGGELPARGEALASLFNALVLTLDAQGKPLLLEENFDAAAVDWLEKASAIVNAARKKHGENWKTSDEVLDTINALSKPGDALKALKDIRAAQKGDKPEGEKGNEGTIRTITPALAAEYLKQAIAEAATKPEDEQYALCCILFELNDAWSALPDKLTRKLAARYAKAQKAGVAPHVEVVKNTTPEAVAA